MPGGGADPALVFIRQMHGAKAVAPVTKERNGERVFARRQSAQGHFIRRVGQKPQIFAVEGDFHCRAAIVRRAQGDFTALAFKGDFIGNVPAVEGEPLLRDAAKADAILSRREPRLPPAQNDGKIAQQIHPLQVGALAKGHFHKERVFARLQRGQRVGGKALVHIPAIGTGCRAFAVEGNLRAF